MNLPKNTAQSIRKATALLAATASICGTLLGQTPAKPDPDVLELNDGEKLIGHLVSGAGASLTFHSDAAGNVTIDWAKVKSLKTSEKFAVAEKGVVLDKHSDPASVPQGTVSIADQKLAIDPGTGAAATVIPVADAKNVVPQPNFLNAFKTPRFDQGWHGTAGLGIDLIRATQKSRSFTASVALQRVVSDESWISPRYKTLFNLNFADSQLSQSGAKTISTDLLHAGIEHDIFLSRRLFAFVAADFLHSTSQGMKLQQTYGGGIGYEVLKTDKQEFDVKAGIDYIRQSFDAPAPPPILAAPASKSLIGASLGETYTRSFSHGVALHEGGTFIPAFNDTSAYTANAFLNLSIPVGKRLGITIGGLDSYINQPPVGFQRNSFEFVTQIAYKIN